MGEPKRKRATYDDLLLLPDHLVGEIIDGEVVTSPRPGPAHATTGSALVIELGGSFDGPSGRSGGPGGWRILYEPELHLGEDILVPDIAGWRLERMPKLPSTPAFELAPDWVCEILSPSTASVDRTRKMRIYARAKVPFLWLVDPIVKTLEVYQQSGQLWTLLGTYAAEEKVRAQPFEAVELDLARWWAES